MPNPAGHRLEGTLSAYATPRGPVTNPDRDDFTAALRGEVTADQAAGAWPDHDPPGPSSTPDLVATAMATSAPRPFEAGRTAW
jgi:hypothetical protein